MDDEKLVEAVARAIDDVSFGEVKGLDPKGICRVFARAALAVIRPVVIEECARVCDELRHPDWSCESGAWVNGTDACAAAIRALAAPRVKQETKP